MRILGAIFLSLALLAEAADLRAGGGLTDGPLLAHQVSAALTAGAAFLALALVVVLALIVRPRDNRVGVGHGRK